MSSKMKLVCINPNTLKDLQDAIERGKKQAQQLVGMSLIGAKGPMKGNIYVVYAASFDYRDGTIFVSVQDKQGVKWDYYVLSVFEPIPARILRKFGLQSKII